MSNQLAYQKMSGKSDGIDFVCRNAAAAIIAIGFVFAIGTAKQADAKDFWVPLSGANCKIWSDEAPNPKDQVTWSGDCKGGKVSGTGKLEWKRDGKVLGTYDGNMAEGRFSGSGRLRLAIKSGGFEQMEGFFRNGVIGDIGLYSDSAGNIYDGELKDGKPDGTGYSKGGGEEYAGEFRNGKRQGIGVLISATTAYVGEFEDDKANGSGVLEDAEGGRMHGQFKDGRPNGAGTYVTKDGAVYQGQFKDGNADGKFLVRKTANAEPTIEIWKNGKRVK